MRRCYVLTACGLLCLLAGCGGGDPFSYVKVSGKVTYDDGSRIAAPEIKLTFYPLAPPVDSKTYPRPARPWSTSPPASSVPSPATRPATAWSAASTR